MIFRSRFGFGRRAVTETTILLLLSVVFFVLFVVPVSAQKKYSQNFPAGQNVRLQLTNRMGTVTVKGWNRPMVNVSASLESPAAAINPQMVDGVIIIDLVRDNNGRGGIGNVNFTVQVPFYTAVDIETKIGNLSVSNIRSGLVRAHITSEGDITLTNILSANVSAENVTGDIFFDGEFLPNGNYRFSSVTGAINLNIPFPSNFKLIATAQSSRSIDLGNFSEGNLKYLGDGRRITGQLGNGSAWVQIINQRGIIQFIRR
jgi:hypothetical protein